MHQDDPFPSIDSSATITEKTFHKVDLFCPHPFLRAQQAKVSSQPKSKSKAFVRNPEPLLSTTAFRRTPPRVPATPRPRSGLATATLVDFRAQFCILLGLTKDMQPQEFAPLARLFVPVLMEVRRNLNHLRLNGAQMVQVR
jgi:hypothetical protein